MSNEKRNFDLKAAGSRLKEVRTKTGLTLEKISELSGLSTSGLSDMEKGKTRPSSLYLYFLAREYKVNINWILTGEGKAYVPEVEFDLDFGADNETVKEMLYCLRNVDVVRYELLRTFAQFRIQNKGLIEGWGKSKD